uniref:Alkylglycerol monooxygenase n=1 Tax=Plectus sambesii TaxID=2011161 RepID=A0A914ULR5_9BILA
MTTLTEKLSTDMSIHNLRRMFYLVTPSETKFSTIEEVPNYTDQVTGWFFLLMALEYLILWLKNKEDGFALNDTITSMNAGMLSQLLKFGGRTGTVCLYVKFYEHYRIVDLPWDSTWTWVLCFLTQDLAYYLGHRAIHEAGVFWSFHQMHHSSEYYNLSTALRQGCVQELGMMWFDLLQSTIIPPQVFLTHRYLNGLYQFWLHTEVVGNLGPFEYIMNTPSHHRVHHGRNPYCIDKNYAGTLIIWDRLFGTFEAERDTEPPVYGLVTNVRSFNQLWCQFFEFKELGYDKGQMKTAEGEELFPTFWDKVKAALYPPGYFPGVKTKWFFTWLCMKDSEEGIPQIEDNVQKYNPKIPFWLNCYCALHFVMLLGIYVHFSEFRTTMPTSHFVLYIAFLVLTMQSMGAFLDKRSYAVWLEMARCFLTYAYLYMWSADGANGSRLTHAIWGSSLALMKVEWEIAVTRRLPMKDGANQTADNHDRLHIGCRSKVDEAPSGLIVSSSGERDDATLSYSQISCPMWLALISIACSANASS